MYMHRYIYINVSLHKKCPYLGLFWSVFSRIWSEYREIWSISPHSVQMREMWTRITPNTDTFHKVYVYIKYMFI